MLDQVIDYAWIPASGVFWAYVILKEEPPPPVKVAVVVAFSAFFGKFLGELVL
jgi:hypothetical protein